MGYFFDEGTGLYYLQSRYYDAEVGRFVNGDDVTNISIFTQDDLSADIYSYCGNAPVVNKDPEGFSFKNSLWGIIKKFGSKLLKYIKNFWKAFKNIKRIYLKPLEIIIDFLVGVLLPAIVKPLKLLSKVLTSYKSFNSKLVESVFKSVGSGMVGFFKKLGIKITYNSLFTFFVNNAIFEHLSRFLTIGGIICFALDRIDGKTDYYLKFR